jgi:hypothetical protein
VDGVLSHKPCVSDSVHLLSSGAKTHFSVDCVGGTADGCDDFQCYDAAVVSILIVLLPQLCCVVVTGVRKQQLLNRDIDLWK